MERPAFGEGETDNSGLYAQFTLLMAPLSCMHITSGLDFEQLLAAGIE